MGKPKVGNAAQAEYSAQKQVEPSGGVWLKIKRTLIVGGRIENVEGMRTEVCATLEEAQQQARGAVRGLPFARQLVEAIDAVAA